MKATNEQANAIRDSLEFRRFYFWACIGFSLIGLTYLSRETLSRLNEGLAMVLGIMPSLAGSFATPYIFLLGIAMQRKEQSLLKNSQIFFLTNLSVLALCVLLELLHSWLNLGGFHWNDIVASIAGMIVGLLSFYLLSGQKVPNAHLGSE